MRQSPEVSATSIGIGKRKRGVDGNLWVVVKTKNGVKRWQRLKADPKDEPKPVLKVKNASLVVNRTMLSHVSVEMDSKNTKITLKGPEGEIVKRLLKLPSMTITKPTSQLYHDLDDLSIYNRKARQTDLFEFKIDKNTYHVSAKSGIRLFRKLFDLLNPNKIRWSKWDSNQYGDKTTTLFGKGVNLTRARAKKLKPGHKYYLFTMEGGAYDYKGDTLQVLEFDGFSQNDHTENLLGTLYDSKTKKTILGSDFSWIFRENEGNTFTRGGFPLFIVTKWHPGFKPPSKLPKAELFSSN